MNRLGSDAEFRRLAAEQASQFFPPQKKRGGRKKHAVLKPIFSDPLFMKKLVAGRFYDWPDIKHLMAFYSAETEPIKSLDDKKQKAAALKSILSFVAAALGKRDFKPLYTLARAVEMFAVEKAPVADMRKASIAFQYFKLVQKQKRKPTAAELVAFCRQDQEVGKILSQHLDESVFRDIRQMQLPVVKKPANKNKKSS